MPLPSEFIAQNTDEVTVPDGAVLLTDTGADHLLTACKTSRQCEGLVAQGTTFELIAIQLPDDPSQMYVLVLRFMADFHQSYDDAQEAHCERHQYLLFASWPEAYEGLLSISADLLCLHSPLI